MKLFVTEYHLVSRVWLVGSEIILADQIAIPNDQEAMQIEVLLFDRG